MDIKEEITEIFKDSEFKKLINSTHNYVNIPFINITELCPELADKIIDNPEISIKEMEAIIESEFLIKSKIRFTEIPETRITPIRNIRAKHLKKLVVIDGIIRQATEVRPRLYYKKYECGKCGNIFSAYENKEDENIMRCNCGSKNFNVIDEKFIDNQKISIEESPDSLEHTSSQPKRMHVILEDGLVDPKYDKRTSPGSKVRIIGILKEVPVLKNGKKNNRREIVIEANNLIPLEEDNDEIKISKEDLDLFESVSNSGSVLQKFTESFATSIIGHEAIKRAIVLQLFGGVRKKKSDSTYTRGNIHNLLVGDPSTAKSLLLRNAKDLMPKARFVSGKSTSSAGLTAAVVKDELNGYWSFEAGAMVLANNSLIAVDELDKISDDDKKVLHEAMEQGTISLSKAGVNCTLNTNTSILAAANPKHSEFKDDQELSKQINLTASLLSRFDCVFIVRDDINKNKDEIIADKILGESLGDTNDIELSNEFMKKYINYARKINPILDSQAVLELKTFYTGLRDGGKRLSKRQITPRQLEGLIRFTQAHARMRLSEIATKEDALVAVEIVKISLKQLGYDEQTGIFDANAILSVPTQKKVKLSHITTILADLTKMGMSQIPFKFIEERLDQKIVNSTELWELLDDLSIRGDVIKPKKGVYSLL